MIKSTSKRLLGYLVMLLLSLNFFGVVYAEEIDDGSSNSGSESSETTSSSTSQSSGLTAQEVQKEFIKKHTPSTSDKVSVKAKEKKIKKEKRGANWALTKKSTIKEAQEKPIIAPIWLDSDSEKIYCSEGLSYYEYVSGAPNVLIKNGHCSSEGVSKIEAAGFVKYVISEVTEYRKEELIAEKRKAIEDAKNPPEEETTSSGEESSPSENSEKTSESGTKSGEIVITQKTGEEALGEIFSLSSSSKESTQETSTETASQTTSTVNKTETTETSSKEPIEKKKRFEVKNNKIVVHDISKQEYSEQIQKVLDFIAEDGEHVIEEEVELSSAEEEEEVEEEITYTESELFPEQEIDTSMDIFVQKVFLTDVKDIIFSTGIEFDETQFSPGYLSKAINGFVKDKQVLELDGYRLIGFTGNTYYNGAIIELFKDFHDEVTFDQSRTIIAQDISGLSFSLSSYLNTDLKYSTRELFRTKFIADLQKLNSDYTRLKNTDKKMSIFFNKKKKRTKAVETIKSVIPIKETLELAETLGEGLNAVEDLDIGENLNIGEGLNILQEALE